MWHTALSVWSHGSFVNNLTVKPLNLEESELTGSENQHVVPSPIRSHRMGRVIGTFDNVSCIHGVDYFSQKRIRASEKKSFFCVSENSQVYSLYNLQYQLIHSSEVGCQLPIKDCFWLILMERKIASYINRGTKRNYPSSDQ